MEGLNETTKNLVNAAGPDIWTAEWTHNAASAYWHSTALYGLHNNTLHSHTGSRCCTLTNTNTNTSNTIFHAPKRLSSHIRGYRDKKPSGCEHVATHW